MPEETRHGLKVQAAANMQLSCIEDGCTTKRNSAFSKRCRKCANNLRLYGEAKGVPRGHSYRHKKYSTEIDTVTQLVSANPDHPAIEGACAFLEQWLHNAVHAPDYFGEEGHQIRNHIPGRIHMRTLADLGVYPIEILINLCAAWLYVRLHKRKFDGRHKIVKQLGIAIVRTRPWNESELGKIKEAQTTAIGEHAWQSLIKLFIHIEALFIKRAENHKLLREAIETPLPAELTLTPAELKFVKYRKKEIMKYLGAEAKQRIADAEAEATTTNQDGSTEPGE